MEILLTKVNPKLEICLYKGWRVYKIETGIYAIQQQNQYEHSKAELVSGMFLDAIEQIDEFYTVGA